MLAGGGGVREGKEGRLLPLPVSHTATTVDCGDSSKELEVKEEEEEESVA